MVNTEALFEVLPVASTRSDWNRLETLLSPILLRDIEGMTHAEIIQLAAEIAVEVKNSLLLYWEENHGNNTAE